MKQRDHFEERGSIEQEHGEMRAIPVEEVITSAGYGSLEKRVQLTERESPTEKERYRTDDKFESHKRARITQE